MNLTSINDCYEYALSLLARREHFTKELVQKLKKKEMTDSLIDETVELLHEKNYLNDARATELFVHELKRKRKGFMKIVNELRARGVVDVDSKVRGLYSQEEEKNNAQKVLSLLRKPSREKKYRYLFNRGFSPEIIRSVTQET